MSEQSSRPTEQAGTSALDGHSLAALRLLARAPLQSQRELATALGMSLGRTNFVLRALLEKGHVKVRNFRKSGNKLAYAYVLTPSGIAEKLRLTRRFIQRKEEEFEQLRLAIYELKAELETGSTTQKNCENE